MHDWDWVIDRDNQIEMHIQNGIPCSCGCGTFLRTPQLHHGILPKQMFRGKGTRKAVLRLRDAPVNTFLINAQCHDRVPSPQFFWGLACERYGAEEVRDWYDRCRAIFKSELPNFTQPDLTTPSDMCKINPQ